MAGRPIRMAKKVTALEEKMAEVSELANDYMTDK